LRVILSSATPEVTLLKAAIALLLRRAVGLVIHHLITDHDELIHSRCSGAGTPVVPDKGNFGRRLVVLALRPGCIATPMLKSEII